MRISFVAPFALEPKGTSIGRALPLASALTRRGHQVLLVVPPWDNPAYSGRRLVLQGVPVWHPRLPPRLPPLWYSLVAWRTLRLALEGRPQAVHIFKPKAFSGLVAMACWLLKKARLSSARLVVDTDDWEGRGGWNELNPYGPLQRAFFGFQEGWVLRHASAVTAASRVLCSMAEELGVPSDRIVYLPNGAAGETDVGAIREFPLRVEAGDEDGPGPTLLLYTRFFEFQAQRVISIFREVLALVPEARLLVVGQGLRGEEGHLSRLVEEAGLWDRVEMAGWGKPDEMPQYFRRAQAAIYPLDDTLVNRAKCPLKLVELMQAGLPVVADRVGQASEYVEDGKSGLLAEPGDVAGFAARAARLLKDVDLRRDLGKAARARVTQEFSWDRLAQRAEEAYGL